MDVRSWAWVWVSVLAKQPNYHEYCTATCKDDGQNQHTQFKCITDEFSYKLDDGCHDTSYELYCLVVFVVVVVTFGGFYIHV